MQSTNFAYCLSHLCIVEIAGSDAENFLHSQLTANIKRLPECCAKFAAWCNPKGRVRVSFFLYRYRHKFILLLPMELQDSFIREILKYVLSADVRLVNKNDVSSLIGLYVTDISLLTDIIGLIPENPGDIVVNDQLHCLRIASPDGNKYRYLIISANQDQSLRRKIEQHFMFVAPDVWELLDIRTTYPWITIQTTEEFLPQMLALDIIGGLDYEKGCYQGQEIISRLYFRGQLKRRLYLLSCISSYSPASGDHLYGGERASKNVGTILNAQSSNGECYILAVVEDHAIHSGLYLDDATKTECHLQPLPYDYDDSRKETNKKD